MGPVKALDEDSLRRAVLAAGIDAQPVWVEETGSTNELAVALAEKGAPEWTVVAAGHQTAGRGRLGRSWSDAPGKALMCSVVLRPGMEAEEASLITLAAATSLVHAAGPPLRSKWPNDLVVGERKAGGILGEARLVGGRVEHAVLGFGVNLTMTADEFPPAVRQTATSLSLEGLRAEAEPLLTRFLARFRRERFDAAAIVPEYRDVCATLGRRVRAGTTSGAVVEGVAVDLDRHGGLVVEGDGGTQTVAFGEVAHLDQPPAALH